MSAMSERLPWDAHATSWCILAEGAGVVEQQSDALTRTGEHSAEDHPRRPGIDAESDDARYRTLGNAVTVNVSEWLGGRIVAAEAQMSHPRQQEGARA